MSLLPRVTQRARELLAREFDTRGPMRALAEIIDILNGTIPSSGHGSQTWAADLGNSEKAMLGFSMFYRLLIPASSAEMSRPRSFALAKNACAAGWEIDEKGPEDFTMEAIAELEESIPSSFRWHTIGVKCAFGLSRSSLTGHARKVARRCLLQANIQ